MALLYLVSMILTNMWTNASILKKLCPSTSIVNICTLTLTSTKRMNKKLLFVAENVQRHHKIIQFHTMSILSPHCTMSTRFAPLPCSYGALVRSNVFLWNISRAWRQDAHPPSKFAQRQFLQSCTKTIHVAVKSTTVVYIAFFPLALRATITVVTFVFSLV